MDKDILLKVEKLLEDNYSECFSKHGPTLQGLDWESEENAQLRYRNMLKLFGSLDEKTSISILDVGCGYARFFEYLNTTFGKEFIDTKIKYTGIDVVKEMVEYCQNRYSNASFLHKSIFEMTMENSFDYVFCNGVLTKKCASTQMEMDVFADAVIRKIFSLCKRGAYFNLFSNQVGWFESQVYYRSPVEILTYCLQQLTPYVVLDHTIPRYEFIVYLYKELQFEKI